MMKTKKILEAVGLIDPPTEEETDPSVVELFEAEMCEVLLELAALHADDPKYATSVANLEHLTEACLNYERAVAESEKTHVELDKNNKMLMQKCVEIIPRGIGIVLSSMLTYGWFLVEQQHPVANKLINKTNELMTRS